MLQVRKTGRKNNKKVQLNVKENVQLVRKKSTKNKKAPRTIKTSGTRDLAKSLADPFTYNACIPDGSKNVGCFTLKGLSTITTSGANGTVIFAALCPNPASMFYINNGTAPNYTINGSWSSSSALSAVSAAYDRWRPVSAAIKCTFTGAWDNNQGTVTAGVLPAGTAISVFNGGTIASFPTFCSLFQTTSCSAVSVDPLLMTWRPEDMEDFQFSSFGTAQTAATAQTIPTIIIALDGLAPSGGGTALFELIVQCEGYYGLSAATFGARTQPMPAEMGWYENAMNLIQYIPQVGTWLTRNSKQISNVTGNLLKLAYPAQSYRPPLQLGWR